MIHKKILAALILSLFLMPLASAITLKTVAIDGRDLDNNGDYNFLPSTITVNGNKKTNSNSPYVSEFTNVAENRIIKLTYSSNGYETNNDWHFFDPKIENCRDTTKCEYTTNGVTTTCKYLSSKDWVNCKATSDYGTTEFSYDYRVYDNKYQYITKLYNLNGNPELSLEDYSFDEDTAPPSNWINLYEHTYDFENLDDELSYKITSQSNPGLTSCSITSNKYIECSAPAADENGYNDLSIKVTDNKGESTTDTLRVAVSPINDAPVLDTINDKSTQVGNEITFTISASDVDEDTLTYSAANMPTGATFAHQTFNWTPSQIGNYTITFSVQDPSGVEDSQDMTIEVTQGQTQNSAPVLESISDISAREGDLVKIVPNATDEDGDSLTYTFTAPLDANGEWQTVNGDAGEYTTTVTVSDGELTDSQDVTITINEQAVENSAPVLEKIENITANEADLVKIDPNATDEDGDTLTYTFTAPLDSNGEWQTVNGDAGEYTTTVTVSDGELTDSQDVTITINDVNDAPVLDPIENVSVDEGDLVTVTATATDSNSDELSYTYSNPLNSSGEWQTIKGDAGEYSVTITVSDGELTDSQEVIITVNGTNTAPVLDEIGDKSVYTNELLEFIVTASDADGDALTYSIDNAPSGSSFDVNNTQTFSWTPTSEQNGTYDVIFSVSDGYTTVSEPITITVNNTPQEENNAPILDAINSKSTNEDSELTFSVTASDADNESLTYSAANMPAGATFSAQTFTWTPTYEQAGSYDVNFSVTNGTATDSEVVTITVSDVNRAPVLDAIADVDVNENELVIIEPTATDADGDELTYTYAAPLNSSGEWLTTYEDAGTYTTTVTVSDGELTDSQDVTITINDVNREPTMALPSPITATEGSSVSFDVTTDDADGDEVAVSAANMPNGASFNGSKFEWIPTYEQAGEYEITFSATDGVDSTTGNVSITVKEENREPILDAIGSKSTNENTELSFSVSASDADNDSLSYSAANLPSGATFSAQTFTWTPTYEQSGNYDVNFSVTDGTATDSEVVTITISDVNRAPVLDAIADMSVNEGELVDINPTATDADGDSLSYTFTTPLNSSGEWLTKYEDAGTYTTTVTVSDGELTDSQNVTVTINDVNREPILEAIGTKSTDENTELSFSVTASDADGDSLTYNAVGLPNGAMFNEQTFNWTPTYEQAGNYNVNFSVTDGTATDSEVITITVNDVNREPVLETIADVDVNENELVLIEPTATDADGDELTYSFTEPLNSSGEWLTNYSDAGTYTTTITVSDGELTDSQNVTVTINDVNREPILEAIGTKSTNENAELTITVSATDADGDNLTYSATNLPAGATFSAQTFNWTPTYEQAGSYDVNFSVTDGTATDSEVITITVNDVNREPILASISNMTVNETELVVIAPNATDADGDALTYTYAAPLNSSGEWLTTYEDAGEYTTTVTVSDGELTDSQNVTITVNDVNREPVLQQIESQSIIAGELLTIELNATDADNDTLTYSTNATFGTLNSTTGVFTWTPTNDYSGNHTLEFIVDDGEDNATTLVNITVIAKNATESEGLAAIVNALPTNSTIEYNSSMYYSELGELEFDIRAEWNATNGTVIAYFEYNSASDSFNESEQASVDAYANDFIPFVYTIETNTVSQIENKTKTNAKHAGGLI